MDDGLVLMTVPVIRRPAVAGYYYPADAGVLQRALDQLVGAAPAVRDSAVAVVVPHGSLRSCGAVIGSTLRVVEIPRRCIVLGPSHVDRRLPWSLMTGGAYRTPLGDVSIDAACAEALLARCPFLESDAWAQRGEHAIEVILPFLQRVGPQDLSIVPIIVDSYEPDRRTALAETLAQVVRLQEEPVLLIASSDLSHYQPQDMGAEQDQALLRAICALDGAALGRCVQDERIRMCGDAAVACVLDAATQLGARRGEVIRYGTSVESGGDPASAIGYAGVVIS